MPSAISEHDLQDVFDRFREAFATFDGRRVASLFEAPGVALRQDGGLRGFSGTDDIAAYYQSALDRYRAAGCSACTWSDLDVVRIRAGSVVATVTWDLLQGQKSIRRWRQAYFIARFDGEPRIYGSAFADPR